VAAVASVAAARGVSRAAVALAWLLSKPAVTGPIVGVTKDHHLTDAVAALDIALTGEEIALLEEHHVPHHPEGFRPCLDVDDRAAADPDAAPRSFETGPRPQGPRGSWRTGAGPDDDRTHAAAGSRIDGPPRTPGPRRGATLIHGPIS